MEWSIAGRHFSAAVPVQLKWDSTSALFGTVEADVPSEDHMAELDWLIRAIRVSKDMPADAPYMDLA